MDDTFDAKFSDSNEFTFYKITIESENGQTIVFDGVTDTYTRDVFTILEPQASEEEL